MVRFHDTNKSDYSLPKSYRIITLLNYLGKIVEKIVANRLAYFGENSNLLETVVHDIEIANRRKNDLSLLLLDIKGAYNFVSINQLLNIMKNLKLSSIVTQWVIHFMKKRSVNLIFDENKSKIYYIESGFHKAHLFCIYYFGYIFVNYFRKY